jgi:hypothetical protein
LAGAVGAGAAVAGAAGRVCARGETAGTTTANRRNRSAAGLRSMDIELGLPTMSVINLSPFSPPIFS